MAVFDDTAGFPLRKSFSFTFPTLRRVSFAPVRLWRRNRSLPDIPGFLRCSYQRIASLSVHIFPLLSRSSTQAGTGSPIFPSIGKYSSAWITVPKWFCAHERSRRWMEM